MRTWHTGVTSCGWWAIADQLSPPSCDQLTAKAWLPGPLSSGPESSTPSTPSASWRRIWQVRRFPFLFTKLRGWQLKHGTGRKKGVRTSSSER